MGGADVPRRCGATPGPGHELLGTVQRLGRPWDGALPALRLAVEARRLSERRRMSSLPPVSRWRAQGEEEGEGGTRKAGVLGAGESHGLQAVSLYKHIYNLVSHTQSYETCNMYILYMSLSQLLPRCLEEILSSPLALSLAQMLDEDDASPGSKRSFRSLRFVEIASFRSFLQASGSFRTGLRRRGHGLVLTCGS